jgi:hypothetical protein
MVLGLREFLQLLSVWSSDQASWKVVTGMNVPHIDNIIDMIAQRNKQVEEKFTPTLHLQLHGSAPLKCLATSNDQGQIMSAEPRIRVGRVVISIPRRAQNRRDLDSALQTLLPKSKALEFLEPVLLCCAVYDCVLQEVLTHVRNVSCSFDRSATTCRVLWVWRIHNRVFELPRVMALAV